MTKKASTPSTKNAFVMIGAAALVAGAAFVLAYGALPELMSVSYSRTAATSTQAAVPKGPPPPPPLDTTAYNLKLLALAHVATSSPWYAAFLQGTTTVTLPNATTSVHVAKKPWPVSAAYPRDSRALLPFNRIVAYYGNFYAKGMGVLGQYPPEEMVTRLKNAAAQWRTADPSTPVIPAIHYIAVVAQGSAGKDGKYRTRMPDSQVEQALALAKEVDGVVFLDIQVALSDVQTEVPMLENFWKLPNVHLGLDPEFAMHNGTPPGKVIGSLDADDINWAIQYLSALVRQYDLPPKILVIHRFTHDMLTGYQRIKPTPEVQVVVDMDGWGGQAKKQGTYNNVIAPEPVQFTGFKLFYKNDVLDGTTMLTPPQVLELTPAPIYIQYQ
ncbi:MAG TPA: hypothetical protein VHD55_04055 [Candidatus Paceibacterota bacterium]|nr:hypothetical protein [Candidatus Paceibacterota bacterium]